MIIAAYQKEDKRKEVLLYYFTSILQEIILYYRSKLLPFFLGPLQTTASSWLLSRNPMDITANC